MFAEGGDERLAAAGAAEKAEGGSARGTSRRGREPRSMTRGARSGVFQCFLDGAVRRGWHAVPFENCLYLDAGQLLRPEFDLVDQLAPIVAPVAVLRETRVVDPVAAVARGARF